MIAGAILYRYVRNGPGEEIPEVLSHALTTILGFYFGSAAVAGQRGTTGAANGAARDAGNGAKENT
jgi:hypothetical protein